MEIINVRIQHKEHGWTGTQIGPMFIGKASQVAQARVLWDEYVLIHGSSHCYQIEQYVALSELQPYKRGKR